MSGVSRYLQRYELQQMLGAGRLGEVHEALQLGRDGFERVVAYKRLTALERQHKRAWRVFEDDARLAGQLVHPNIVRVIDVGEEEGHPFIVMDRVIGADLRSFGEAATQAAHPISLEVAVGIVSQLLEALRHAHRLLDPSGQRAPLIHRAVGPTNVLLSIDGTVRLSDFAIARAEAALLGELDEEPQPSKLAYMAPELLLGDPIDHRADLYSVGVLLYELTLGQRLLRGLDLRTLRRALEQPVAPPTFLRPGYPADLEIIVMRALERYPEDRPSSAEAMLEELEHFAADAGLRLPRLRLGRFVAEVLGLRDRADEPEAPADELAREEEALLGADDLDFDAPPTKRSRWAQDLDEDEEDDDKDLLENTAQRRREGTFAGLVAESRSASAESADDLELEEPVASGPTRVEGAREVQAQGSEPGDEPLDAADGPPTARLNSEVLEGWVPTSERPTMQLKTLPAGATPRALEHTVMVTDDLVEDELELEGADEDIDFDRPAENAAVSEQPEGFLAQVRARSREASGAVSAVAEAPAEQLSAERPSGDPTAPRELVAEADLLASETQPAPAHELGWRRRGADDLVLADGPEPAPDALELSDAETPSEDALGVAAAPDRVPRAEATGIEASGADASASSEPDVQEQTGPPWRGSPWEALERELDAEAFAASPAEKAVSESPAPEPAGEPTPAESPAPAAEPTQARAAEAAAELAVQEQTGPPWNGSPWEALERALEEDGAPREAEEEESDLGLAAPFEIEEQEGESSQPVIELRKPRPRRSTARVLALDPLEPEDRIDTLDEDEEELSVSEVEMIEDDLPRAGASQASVADVDPIRSGEIDAVLEELAELREHDERVEAPAPTTAQETTASRLAAMSMQEERGAFGTRREPTLEIDEEDLLEEDDDEEEPADGLALDRAAADEDEGLDDPTVDAAPATRPTMPPLPDENER